MMSRNRKPSSDRSDPADHFKAGTRTQSINEIWPVLLPFPINPKALPCPNRFISESDPLFHHLLGNGVSVELEFKHIPGSVTFATPVPSRPADGQAFGFSGCPGHGSRQRRASSATMHNSLRHSPNLLHGVLSPESRSGLLLPHHDCPRRLCL